MKVNQFLTTDTILWPSRSGQCALAGNPGLEDWGI